MKCHDCWMLKLKDEEIKQLKNQQEVILETMQMAFTLVSLWEQATGLTPSDTLTEEEVCEERSYRKKQLRTLFDNLIESGESPFLDRLARALNLPQNGEQFLE